MRRLETVDPARERELTLLGAVLLVACLLRWAFGVNFAGSDDISVAGCALRLLDEGLAVPDGHYCARFGLTVPLALVFGAFGTGGAQISLLPGLFSVAAILLSWGIGRALFGVPAGLAAAAGAALFPMAVKFAGLAYPDAMQGTLVAASVLLLLTAAARPEGSGARAVAAGLLWGWAYLVKLDAFVLGPVLLCGAWLGVLRWRHVILACFVVGAIVGAELAAYAVLAGSPLHRVAMESRAAAEILGPGMDYRNLISYPKSMFLLPYEAGIHYFLFVGGAVLAVARRSRPALFLLAWGLLWQVWLTAGFDPFAGLRLKPQISRYLLSWAIPLCVLGGWAVVALWQRSRPAAVAAAAASLACALLFGPFNQLSFESARATQRGVELAQREGWFPLYTDNQSRGMAAFLLHGRPEARRLHPAQRHDFLRGVTSFEPIPGPLAYLLVNEDDARRLAARSLVRPVDPASFGLRVEPVAQVDNPMPALSYAAMRLLVGGMRLLPGPLRGGVEATASELERAQDLRIWRLTAPPG